MPAPAKTLSATDPTPGFRMGKAGLLLPHDTPNARARYVLTSDQAKKLKRAVMDVFGPAELFFTMSCAATGCPDPRCEKIPQESGGFILRCGCRDRVFTPETAVLKGRLWARR